MTMEAEAPTARRDDDECQQSAVEFLRLLIGAEPDDLVWDGDHHLQGHAHWSGREIIVIASRDEAHHPVVLTAEDWDTIRHSFGFDRGELLRRSAIQTRSRFVAALTSG